MRQRIICEATRQELKEGKPGRVTRVIEEGEGPGFRAAVEFLVGIGIFEAFESKGPPDLKPAKKGG